MGHNGNMKSYSRSGWLGSRVVSVLDSGAERPGFKSQPTTLSGNSLRQTVHTHCASVHQAAKLVAALLRVARVTADLAESNGSLPPGLWLTSPAGWLPRTRISSGTLRSAIEYGLPLPFYSRSPLRLYWLYRHPYSYNGSCMRPNEVDMYRSGSQLHRHAGIGW